MKFIGQYIQQLIARFRNDVYLEDVSTGTIASGGNLGLDSNNKIVKNTVSGGGTIDLASDVTGFLPIANGGTGAVNAPGARTSLGLGNVENTAISTYTGNGGALDNQYIANGAGYTTNTGDINRVQISTSSGTASVTSGNADFAITGSTPIGVTNSGTNISITAGDASTSAKGVAQFSSDNFGASSGTITIKSGGVDLTDEVTGTLPVANGGTGLTSLSTLQNSNVPVIIHQFMGYLGSFSDGQYYYGHSLYGPYHHVWNGKVSSEPTDMSDLGAARHSHYMHIVPTDLDNISIKGACQANSAVTTIKFHLYKTTRSNSIASSNSSLTKLGVATTDTIDNTNHLFNCDLTTTDSISAGEALLLLVQFNGTSNTVRWNYTLFGYAA